MMIKPNRGRADSSAKVLMGSHECLDPHVERAKLSPEAQDLELRHIAVGCAQ